MEEFTEQQIQTLMRFVTNTTGHIFALKNLPEVIKGALFSRYSRSTLGLKSLLLKEFIQNQDSGFSSVEMEEQVAGIQKAQNFYDRILDGYGDDSIGELGGAHLALENISMLAAKAIEDCRLGGSPLEKSTRYIYFDQRVDGEYLFYKEPVLLTSAYRDIYLKTCTNLFEVYGKLIPPLTAHIEKGFPHDPAISKTAYTAALRAKVLDCLRGLLPASTFTNMGVFGNGRFFETLLQKFNCNSLQEMQEIGKKSYEELAKVIPSFVRRAESAHKHNLSYAKFAESMRKELSQFGVQETGAHSGVRLVDFDKDGAQRVASHLLFAHSNSELSRNFSEEEMEQILDAACKYRENRRHKSPRALEAASFTFEIVADFGVYRDLHRHRMLTQERQLLSCDLGYYVPPEIVGTEMEEVYIKALDEAKIAFDMIAKEFPEEAQYIVPMAYNVRWYFHVNLRALQWLCELRSQAAGHPSYRLIAQEMAHQVSQAIPQFERFFKFVDYNGYELGRLSSEIRQEQKKCFN
ncbi:MAG TPA: FAD-dependent thymidylate synthase [Chlamydiales bacterium]|nr:FAD-dependent thymidylate synthase [Chlamydiales bacterium]